MIQPATILHPPADTGHEATRVKWKGMATVLASELRSPKGQAWLKTAQEGWGEGNFRVRFVHAPKTAAGARSGIRVWNRRTVEVAIIETPWKKNLVVNVGLQRSADRLFGLSGPPIALRSIGVDNGTLPPTATSVSSTAGGGTDTGSTSRRIILFDASPAPSRTGQIVTVAGTFTQAIVAFTMKRLFLSAAAAGTTDASGDLYSMTGVFTMDLTIFSVWSQTFTATVSFTGT